MLCILKKYVIVLNVRSQPVTNVRIHHITKYSSHNNLLVIEPLHPHHTFIRANGSIIVHGRQHMCSQSSSNMHTTAGVTLRYTTKKQYK